eukprot:symbB.v1.2.012617.t1/scaffold874.1/size155782/11
MTQERSNGFRIDARACHKVHWGPHRNPRLLSEEWLKDEIWRCHGNGPRAMSEKEEELLEKLAAYGGSSFEPILQAFHQEDFIALVQQFVVDHAPFFAETCMDGSHPLVWTQYHDAYKDIFETRLAQILQGIEVVQEDFASFCEWLKVNADIFDDDTEGLYPFLSSITASLDYEAFLSVMFAEARRHSMDVQQIDVLIPDGMCSGQVLLVEYLGSQYEVMIPDGFGAGQLFQTTVRRGPPIHRLLSRSAMPWNSSRSRHLKSEWGRLRSTCSELWRKWRHVQSSCCRWMELELPGRRPEINSEETLRLKARIDVLEEAWALRSTTVGQRAEESIARVEEEVKKIWRELLSKERNASKELGQVEAHLLEELKQRVEKTQSQVAELHALKPEDVDSLMKKMIDEVSHSVKLLGDRCSKLEVDLASRQAMETSSQADRQRTEQLEKMVDLLLQQRRQDLQESQANFREIEARFLDLDQRDHAEKSWRQEAEAIRKEIQEVRATHVPSLFQQHMKAMKAMQEGLAAVRAEVKKLSEVVEAVQASSSSTRSEDSLSKPREVLALKAQVSDLQEQVTQLVVRGLEERFANLRADVTAAVRETKENWAVASRRLSALEAGCESKPCPAMSVLRGLAGLTSRAECGNAFLAV